MVTHIVSIAWLSSFISKGNENGISERLLHFQVHDSNSHTGQHMATELLKTPESTASQLGHPPEKQPGKRLKLDFSRIFQNPLSYQLT